MIFAPVASAPHRSANRPIWALFHRADGPTPEWPDFESYNATSSCSHFHMEMRNVLTSDVHRMNSVRIPSYVVMNVDGLSIVKDPN